jgi:hypothetical protein
VSSSGGLEASLPTQDFEFAFQYVKELILAVMDVQRRTATRGDSFLNHRILAIRILVSNSSDDLTTEYPSGVS